MYKIIGANQVEYGPITAEQLRQWITEGRVNAQTMAQAEGDTTWKPISAFPDFAASFPAAFTPPLTGAPSLPTSINPEAGRALALDQVSGPAIGLIVTGGLGIATALFGVVKNAMGTQLTDQQMQAFQASPQLLHLIQSFTGPVGIAMNLIELAASVFIIFAALKMKRLESFGLAMTASILAMIPFCSCCCVGIPFGIWALVVLNKPEVKSNFN